MTSLSIGFRIYPDGNNDTFRIIGIDDVEFLSGYHQIVPVRLTGGLNFGETRAAKGFLHGYRYL